MGLLGKLLGSEKVDHPELDPSSPAAAKIEANRSALEGFARKVHDRIELVPGERATYAFIGHPPGAFGIAWFEGAEEHNLKRLMAEKKLKAAQVQVISDHLREAYERHLQEPRYATELGGKKVVVTPSPGLEEDVARVVHDVVAD